MIVTSIFALVAATTSLETVPQEGHQEASLGVTANVVRPVEITGPLTDAADPVIVVRNTAAVEVRATGASVTRADPDTTVVTSDGTGVVAITLIF